MRKIMTGFALAAALSLSSGSAQAVDQAVIGKKLLIKNPPSGTAGNKLVYLSKDASIALPGGLAEDPRCVPDGTGIASLTVASTATGESFTIDLGGANCVNWSVNGAGTLYKYKDATGATCKIVLVKNGKLQKAVCKGAQVAYDLGADQVDVSVTLRTGSAPRRWCATFGAAGACQVVKNGTDDKSFLAKNCTTAPGACASPSGAFVDAASLF